jgi:hypothetical protein
MRWWAAWCAFCVGVAIMIFDVPGIGAQGIGANGARLPAHAVDDLDGDEDGDGSAEPQTPDKPAWQTFLVPVLSGSSGLDWLTGGMPDRLIYFAGFDLWRNGLGGYAGFQWAPTGIYREGFILRTQFSDNIDRYTTRTQRYVTEITRGSLMAGFKFSGNHADVQFLAGYELQADLLLVNGRLATPRTRFGTRFTTDVWWEPTSSLMLQGSLSGSTIDDAFSARVAAGWRLFDRFWIGPEASRSRDYYSRQTRIGAHLTGLRTGDYEWTIAAGHIADSYDRDGVYARIGVLLRPPRPLLDEN